MFKTLSENFLNKKMTVFVLMLVYITCSVVLQVVSTAEKKRFRENAESVKLVKIKDPALKQEQAKPMSAKETMLAKKLKVKPHSKAFYLIGGWFLMAAGAGIIINIVWIILTFTKETKDNAVMLHKEGLRCFKERFPFDGYFLLKGIITCIFVEFLVSDIFIAFAHCKLQFRFAKIIMSTVGINFFLFLLLFACVRDRKLSFLSLFGLGRKKFFKLCGCGILGYFAFVPVMLFLTLVSLGLCNFFGVEAKPHQIASYVVNEKSRFVLSYWFFVAVFFAPFFEEIFFRGVMYRVLFKKHSVLVSIIVTSCIFSLLHFNYSQFLVIFFMGVMLNYLYYKTKSLVPCMIFHILNNTVSVSMLYFVLVINK